MDRTPKSHTGRTVALVVGIGVVAFVVIGIWQSLNDYATPPPSFPSLRDQPDPSLHGTVAYYDMGTQCIEAVSASGATARQLYCPQERNLGGGIVLEWQAGGQLAMTLYEWPAGGFLPVWRKSVDASTLEVTDLGLNGVPTSPPELTEPGLGPDGTRIMEGAGLINANNFVITKACKDPALAMIVSTSPPATPLIILSIWLTPVRKFILSRFWT